MSKKLQVNDILAASDIDYIDTLENENKNLRERIEKVKAEKDKALTWVAHFLECSRDECVCGSSMDLTCGHGGCKSTADYYAFPNAKRELNNRDLTSKIEVLIECAESDNPESALYKKINQLCKELK